MLGISSYFKDLSFEYLSQARIRGAEYVFTSLHIPEEDQGLVRLHIQPFLDHVQAIGLLPVFDISMKTFELLGLEENDFDGLLEKGITCIRLDYGFDQPELVKQLMVSFNVFLNASTLDERLLKQCQEIGIDMGELTVMHNFYPKRDTGLGWDVFCQKNHLFKAFGLRVMAFVAGDSLKRFPLYEGLVTVEKHRQIHPLVAAMELLEKGEVDDVVVGDSEAKLSTLSALSEFINNRTVVLPVWSESGCPLDFSTTYMIRRDDSERLIRLNVRRSEDIGPRHNNIRCKGAITQDNRLAGRYCGEIQIQRVSLENSPSSNVIAFIRQDMVDAVDFISSSMLLRFASMNETRSDD